MTSFDVNFKVALLWLILATYGAQLFSYTLTQMLLCRYSWIGLVYNQLEQLFSTIWVALIQSVEGSTLA